MVAAPRARAGRVETHLFLGFGGSGAACVFECSDGGGGRAEPAGEVGERAQGSGVVDGGADTAPKSALELRSTLAEKTAELAPGVAVVGRGGDVEAPSDCVGIVDNKNDPVDRDGREEHSPSFPRGDLWSEGVAVGLDELRDVVVALDGGTDEIPCGVRPMTVLGRVKPAKTPTKPMMGMSAVAATHDQEKLRGGDLFVHPDEVGRDALEQLLRGIYNGGETAGWGRGVRATRGKAIRRQPKRGEDGGSSRGCRGGSSGGSRGGSSVGSSVGSDGGCDGGCSRGSSGGGDKGRSVGGGGRGDNRGSGVRSNGVGSGGRGGKSSGGGNGGYSDDGCSSNGGGNRCRCRVSGWHGDDGGSGGCSCKAAAGAAAKAAAGAAMGAAAEATAGAGAGAGRQGRCRRQLFGAATFGRGARGRKTKGGGGGGRDVRCEEWIVSVTGGGGRQWQRLGGASE
ncbi:hypothetical protein B0H14DRAFT_2652668, partial [Mycena olivaceomarginata]